MDLVSRRSFMGMAATFAALGFPGRGMFANPLGLPLGLQLYSVREQMAQDLDATLAAVAEAGYTEVEAAALPKKNAGQIRAALDKAGLRCVGAHHAFADLQADLDAVVAYDKELGCRFIICSTPGRRSEASTTAVFDRNPFTVDDWHYTADRLNSMGVRTAAAGLRLAYHNHTPEFRLTEGKLPYLELLRLVDPAKVTFEMDCGWVVVGGQSPVALMQSHPGRISLLHVKDFKLPGASTNGASEPKVTELGLGAIDYRAIFAEARRSQHIEHAFVEQEAFDMPWQDSLKIDAAYMRKL